MCFAMDYVPGANYTIDKPREYNFWRNYVPAMKPEWPGKLLQLTYQKPATLVPTALGFHPEGVSTGNQLNLWNYRRIVNKKQFLGRRIPGGYQQRKLASKRLYFRQPYWCK